MTSQDFQWNDDTVSAFLYYRNLFPKWCDCMDCFKKRYVKALDKTIKGDTETDHAFSLRVVTNMEY